MCFENNITPKSIILKVVNKYFQALELGKATSYLLDIQRGLVETQTQISLLKEKYSDLIKDKKEGYREITYKDIVILLRSTPKLAPIYEKELLKNNIPVFSDSSNEYLDTMEIQTIINLLKIIVYYILC